MYSNRDALQTNASISPQDHLLTAMSEIWIWVSSYKMSITKASGIYFCQRPLQRPENDDVIILTPQFRTEWPVWAQMCDLNQLGCVTVASIIKIRVAFVFQPCSQYLLAQNNLIMQYVTWPQASAVGSLSNFHTTLLLKSFLHHLFRNSLFTQTVDWRHRCQQWKWIITKDNSNLKRLYYAIWVFPFLYCVLWHFCAAKVCKVKKEAHAKGRYPPPTHTHRNHLPP